MSLEIINLLNLLQDCPEEAINSILHAFSCPKNKHIEHFLHVNAVSCARQRFAITYLVLNECNEMAGFFTLTHKPVFFDHERLDGKRRRRVRQFCVRPIDTDRENGEQLLASAFLIAQLAKNSTQLTGTTVTGGELLEAAMRTLADIQWSIGGGLVFLECEDERKLLDFYEKHGFSRFGMRHSSEEDECYHQLLRAL